MTQQSYSEQSWRQPAEPWQGKAEPWQGKAEPRRGKAEPRRGKAEPRHGKDAFATEAEAVAKLVVLDRVRRAAIRMVVITAILGCCLVGIVVWAAVSGKLDRQIEFMAPVLFLLNLARFRKGLRTLRRMQRAKANLPAQPHRIEAPRSVGHVGEHRGGVSWG